MRDTATDAERVQIEIWRKMTPQQKLALMREMSLAIQHLAFAEMKQRHPEMADDEIWLRLAARRLSPEMLHQVYGRAVDPA